MVHGIDNVDKNEIQQEADISQTLLQNKELNDISQINIRDERHSPRANEHTTG